jgi:hypothetical protein
MSTVKLGPLFDRAVFDGDSRTIKHRLRTVGRFEDVKQLRLREYISPLEEEQLLNAHPDVEKARRDAELWVDFKDGDPSRVATAVQAGLLLMSAGDAAALVGVPLVSERLLIDDSNGGGPVSAAA